MIFLRRRAALAMGALAALAAPAHAQYAAADPAGSVPIVGAVNWLQGTLLGNVATAVAVIAVAAVGFLMLTGRI
ncbi:MAG: TrbC/VirB2 family protein, partial [Sphingomicrobium sp.]